MKANLNSTATVVRPPSTPPGLPRAAFPVLFLGGLALLMTYTVTMTAFNVTTLEWAVGSAMALGLVAAGFARQAAAPTVVLAPASPSMAAIPLELATLAAHLPAPAVTGGEIG